MKRHSHICFSKKADSSQGALLAFVVLIVAVILILYFGGEFITLTNLVTGRQSCVVSSTVSDVFSTVGLGAALQCKAKYIPCLAPTAMDSLPSSQSEGQINSNWEEDELYLFTKEMYDCWDKFGRGKINVRPGGFLESDAHCFVCTRFVYQLCPDKQASDDKTEGLDAVALTGEYLMSELENFNPAATKIEPLQMVLAGFPDYQSIPSPFVLQGKRAPIEVKWDWRDDWNDAAKTGAKIQHSMESGFVTLYNNELNVSRTFDDDKLVAGEEYAIVYWHVPAENKKKSQEFAGKLVSGNTWEGANADPVSYVFVTPADNLENLDCDHIYS